MTARTPTLRVNKLEGIREKRGASMSSVYAQLASDPDLCSNFVKNFTIFAAATTWQVSVWIPCVGSGRGNVAHAQASTAPISSTLTEVAWLRFPGASVRTISSSVLETFFKKAMAGLNK